MQIPWPLNYKKSGLVKRHGFFKLNLSANFIFLRLFKIDHTNCLSPHLQCIIRPTLEYAMIIWDPLTQTDNQKLERVQEKVVT